MKLKLPSASLLSLLFVGLFWASSSFADSNALKELTAAGCKTEYFLIEDLARGFKGSEKITISPNKTGNKVALKLLAAGSIDFAFTCKHHVQLVEKFNLTGSGVDDWTSLKFAYDPIGVIVNRDNPVISLTLAQLKAIFMGDVTNWKELGGEDLPILAAHLGHTVGSGVVGVFREIVLGQNAAGELNLLLKSGFSYSGPKKLGAYVAQNKGEFPLWGLIPTSAVTVQLSTSRVLPRTGEIF